MILDILYINDVHSYLETHPELYYNENGEFIKNAGGYARIATIIKSIRNNNNNTLLFDGGDTFHGTLPIVKSKGEKIIPILNQLNFNAMVGHWDFGYGPEQLKNLISMLNYPMLGINVYKDDSTLFLEPFAMIDIDNIKIGVIGICSDIIDKTMPSKFSKGLKITNGMDELPFFINKVRQLGADIVILLSHNGFPQDMYMLRKIQGVDICLSAHTHNRLYEPEIINDSILIQCGCHGSFLGNLKIKINNKKISEYTYNLLDVNEEIAEDENIKSLVDVITNPYNELKNNIVGKTNIILHRYNTLNSSMDYLLLSAIKYVSNTQISFSNGWRYGIPIRTGDITEYDLYNIIPMNPPVSTCELTGGEIIELLEENLERTFSSVPMNQMGGYVKRCSGLTINIRIENPYGSRIQEIYSGNSHLKKDFTYKVSYVTSQGVPDKYGKNKIDLNIDAVNAMKKFLRENPAFDFSGYKSFRLV